jgi:dihydroorotate dehydrogenase electron transfer subunit
MIKAEQPTALRIAEVVDEAQDVKTFFFNHKLDAEPGQFVMLWLPGINQKPFGVSYLRKDSFGVTVSRVGPFTEEVFKLKKGDLAGIQGPYGNPFSMDARNAVLVAGGYGAAPLGFLAEECASKSISTTFVIGARRKRDLLFVNRFKDPQIDTVFCTEDGSYGERGLVTEAAERLLAGGQFDTVYTCGPELMMKKVLELSDTYKTDCQLSLERYMKCGFGICGQCAVDPLGIRVCMEGPVFGKEVARKITEFGEYERDATGRRIPFDR